MAETADEPVDQPIKQKICVLKASIHCEGCKRKVKKILSHLQGVEFVDVDTKQQKVTVIGNVDADTLLKKLAKSGKKAELWPQKPDKIHGIGNNKEKEIETQRKMDHREPNPASDNGKAPEAATKVQVATKDAEGISGGPVKASDGGSSPTDAGSGGGATAKAVPVKTAAEVEETEKEDNTREENCSAAVKPPQAAERKEAVEKSNGGGGESGTSGKRKKKKGQIGNSTAAAPPTHRELDNHEPGPPHAANQSPPRSHHYPPPHSYYAPPPPPQPVYAVSYNTAYPTSSNTPSYYAAPPPYSYAYMHPGPVAEPPPSDPYLNPRQPLDSFEIFSDENPNGCFVM